MGVLSCKSTAWPDGTVINHVHGMAKPKVRCMNEVMKQAILQSINQESIKINQFLTLNRFKNA